MVSLRGALSGLGAGVAMVALLAAITLAASTRRSELAGFEPWQETPWDSRASQGLDAQGQDWFDQPGSFAGGGYAGAIAGHRVPGMMLTQDAAFQPWQETPWSGRATQGLDAQGQDWFDQPGSFVGGGYAGAIAKRGAMARAYQGRIQSLTTKARTQSLYQESFDQAMKAQKMYDEPRNTVVHSDSAGHVDIEHFGMNVREHFVPLSMKPGIYRDH